MLIRLIGISLWACQCRNKLLKCVIIAILEWKQRYRLWYISDNQGAKQSIIKNEMTPMQKSHKRSLQAQYLLP